MSSSSSKYTTKLSQNVSGLTGGKTYYVRVRAYKLDSAGSKVYGSWSSKAKVIIPSKVTFKGNGGTAGSSSIYVVTGKKYGTLPTATRTGYTFAGWYTAKSGGTRVKVSTKVTATANSTLYAHWTKVTVKKASKPSVTAKTSKSISVKITKVSGVKGYQIRYSLNKDMSSSKTKTVTTLKNTISGLKSGSKYYVQVRAYKLDSKGKKVYGSWSSKVSVKLS
ncbi:MAG: InlB B-repeat-containing protein [Clostridiales bacterium]|nr:InlB B-repeat-containing protein [Clostridiales bacterium]